MDKLPALKPLKLEGNLAENWRRWKQRYELFMTATEASKKSGKIQSSMLLHLIGEDALEVFNTFEFESEEDKEKPGEILKKFDEYCNPKRNLTVERHIFNSRMQQSGESFDQYITDLRLKVKTCEYGTMADEMIKDRIVVCVQSDIVRGRLLREKDLNLSKAIEICKAAEASTKQLEKLADEKKVDILQANRSTTHRAGTQNDSTTPQENYRYPRNNSNRTTGQACQNCGRNHPPRRCPAYGKTCNSCNKLNHFAKFCRSKPATEKKVNVVDEAETEDQHDSDSSSDNFFIGSVKTSNTPNEWLETVEINSHNTKCKIDTGAQCNVLPVTTFRKLIGEKGKLSKSKVKLISFSGHRTTPEGKITTLIQHKNKYYPVEFQVVDIQHPTPILGVLTSQELGLVKRIHTVKTNRQDILSNYPDVFEGLGCLPVEHHIELNETVEPVIHPPRRVPEAIRSRVTKELHRREEEGVIEKVDQPTDWVNSMVTVIKPHKTRICLDPRNLNEAIKREHFPLPTIEEVTARMPNAKVFSVLDAKSGFWQIPLDEASSLLCTFNTPHGRYKFKRLPFGIKSAPEVFQKHMKQLLEGLDGVEVIMDDILVWGENNEQHDERLVKLLERVKAIGLQLNKDKCKIGLTEIPYIGHLLSEQGVKPDPSKVDAILNMPCPTNKQDLQRFMGMLAYLSKFIPNMAEESAPLRQLLEKNVQWHWSDEHQKSLDSLKTLLTKAPVLKYYAVNEPLVLSVDASSEGLGAVLLQNKQPVAYASKPLTECQKRYAQIEKELLAILHGCEHFHQYIYGRTVVVETDHKPLEAIVTKPLYRAPIRLQRMLLRLQQYDISVVHKPGKQMYIADALSRATTRTQEFKDGDTPTEDTFHVHIILPATEEKLDQIRNATEKDPELRALKTTVQNGWPSNRSDTPLKTRSYWSFRDELSCYDGLMFRGEQLIIPASERASTLEKLHQAHLGIELTLRRARDVIFWPGMSKQITEMIAKCSLCLEHRNSQCKEPMLPHEIPDRPWSKLGADLFELHQDNYLLLVDYYSNFFEVMKLTSTKTPTIIKHCKTTFARHGIPDVLISDNGPQFDNAEFKRFAKEWNFTHKTSSPYYPKSNGLAERTIQTLKKVLKKARKDGTDPNLAILELRNTPRTNDLGSPAQRLFSRRTKTLLPVSDQLLKPKVVENVAGNLKNERDRQKRYYDQHTALLPKLGKGDHVMAQKDPKANWQPAIVKKEIAPRSYLITDNNDRVYRRNRSHLMRMKVPETSFANSTVRSTSTSGKASPSDSRQEVQRERQTTQVNASNPSEHTGLRTSRYGRTIKPNLRYTEQ